ncbi:MAG: hypothetical protein ACREGG_01810 [Candidatus Saccharimonadales bacterium]
MAEEHQNHPSPNTEVKPEPEVSQPAEPDKKEETGFRARLNRFRCWYVEHKKWTIPASVLLIILILAGVPFTRYQLAGLALKRDVSLKVVDATAATPVSGATVSVGPVSAQTDGSGKATLRHIKVGNQTVLITKKYYKNSSIKLLNPILRQKTVPSFQLTATGRQVQITVTNLINKNPLADVDISVGGVSAKTDKSGSATVVLPVGTSQQKTHLSLNGYNDADVTVQVSNDTIQNNQFNLTPAGKVYFLSKLSGTIDVVKTNLDGSDRQTVLAGTGKEDDQNTVLLASRDWKYLALLSRRAGGSSPSLYLIDTSNDSVSTIDEGNINLQLLGWSDDYFTYISSENGYQPWQPKASSLKSYNAQTKQLAVLDSTNAIGSSLSDAQYETFGADPILLDNLVVYSKTWYQYPGYLQVAGQSNTLNVIKPNNTGRKTIKSLDSGQSYFGSLVFHAPSSVYVQISNLDSSPSTFYEFNGIGLSQNNNLTSDDIFAAYPTYLYSPDDSQTFWSEPRDGKNTLFIGDGNGQNGKQIATLSDYSPYGWYTTNYLLVSQNASELYIMASDGKQTPIKISDYNKPAQTFNGYGGGYGGL